MSPEQFAQSGISPRSDLYSLGLIIYEMLTRKKACVAATYEEATNWHTNTSLDVSSINISDAFKEFISTCTAKDPDKRFLNVQKALDALRGNVKGGQATSSARLQLEQERLKQEKEQKERELQFEQEKLKQEKAQKERELHLEQEKLKVEKERIAAQKPAQPVASKLNNFIIIFFVLPFMAYGFYNVYQTQQTINNIPTVEEALVQFNQKQRDKFNTRIKDVDLSKAIPIPEKFHGEWSDRGNETDKIKVVISANTLDFHKPNHSKKEKYTSLSLVETGEDSWEIVSGKWVSGVDSFDCNGKIVLRDDVLYFDLQYIKEEPGERTSISTSKYSVTVKKKNRKK